MRDSQNSDFSNEQPSPAQGDDLLREKDQPSRTSYYYDDATGYEIYHEGSEDEEEGNRADKKSEPK